MLSSFGDLRIQSNNNNEALQVLSERLSASHNKISIWYFYAHLF